MLTATPRPRASNILSCHPHPVKHFFGGIFRTNPFGNISKLTLLTSPVRGAFSTARTAYQLVLLTRRCPCAHIRSLPHSVWCPQPTGATHFQKHEVQCTCFRVDWCRLADQNSPTSATRKRSIASIPPTAASMRMVLRARAWP